MLWEPALRPTTAKSLVRKRKPSFVDAVEALREAADAIVGLRVSEEEWQQPHLTIPQLRRGYSALFSLCRVLESGKCNKMQEHTLTSVTMELADVLNRRNGRSSSGVTLLTHECAAQCPFLCLSLTNNADRSTFLENPWFHFVNHRIRFCLSSQNDSVVELRLAESSETVSSSRPSDDRKSKNSENEYFRGPGYNVLERLKGGCHGDCEVGLLRHHGQAVRKCVEEFVHAESSYLHFIAGGVPAPPQLCGAQCCDSDEKGGEDCMQDFSAFCSSQGPFEQLFRMDRIYFVAAVADACVNSDAPRPSIGLSGSTSSSVSGSFTGGGCSVERHRHDKEVAALRCCIACFVNSILEARIICTIICEAAPHIDVSEKGKEVILVNGKEGDDNDSGICLIIRGTALRTDALLDSLATSLRDWLEKEVTTAAPESPTGVRNFYGQLGGILLASYRCLEICCVSGSPGADDVFPHLVALCGLLRSGPWLYSVLCWWSSDASARYSWRKDEDQVGGAHRYARASFQAALLHVLPASS